MEIMRRTKSTREKTSQSRVENQLTQSESENRTRATFTVGGECSHHDVTTAFQTTNGFEIE